jgi:predicted metal-dependent hydrolase
MPEVAYGSHTIQYTVQEEPELDSHYITVEKGAGVVLKGKPVSSEQAEKLILKKARWILEKLSLVSESEKSGIVTGSRILYLGKQYYTEVLYSEAVKEATIAFNHSQFKVTVNTKAETQQAIQEALESFYRAKAVEKVGPRVKRLSSQLNLPYSALKFRKMGKRWGSCTADNTIILNFDAIKLPYTLIDYLIVHELCHTVVKSHSKEFWMELAKHLPDWKRLDERMSGMKL